VNARQAYQALRPLVDEAALRAAHAGSGSAAAPAIVTILAGRTGGATNTSWAQASGSVAPSIDIPVGSTLVAALRTTAAADGPLVDYQETVGGTSYLDAPISTPLASTSLMLFAANVTTEIPAGEGVLVQQTPGAEGGDSLHFAAAYFLLPPA
jgi:hypothetical protein